MAIRVRDDARSMLAIAAALNATAPFPMESQPFTHVRLEEGPHGVHTGVKGILEIEMEDYWRYNPKESRQFDEGKTLAFVKQLSDEEVLALLRAMGRAPGDPCFSEKWEAFIDALRKEHFDIVAKMLGFECEKDSVSCDGCGTQETASTS